MIENKLNLLYEELRDIKKQPDVVHYTNLNNLFGILKSGKIKGNDYFIKSKETENHDLEIAVLRRSVDKPIKSITKRNKSEGAKKLTDLTAKADGVKIYLFSDRIKASVRGVKRKPIAELSISKISEFNNKIEMLYAHELRKTRPLDKLKEHFYEKGKELWNRNDGDKKFKAAYFDERKEIDDFFKKFNLNPTEESDYNRFKHIVVDLIYLASLVTHSSTYGREGEDRFSFKSQKNEKGVIDYSKSGIPVSSALMKIRIYKKYTPQTIERDLYVGNLVSVKDSIRKLEDFLDKTNKYKNVIIRDEKYKMLINSVNILLDKYKNEETE